MWDLSRLSPRSRTRLTSIAVASGLLMEFIDSTALANALPSMGHYFGIAPAELKLALTAYVLALAVFIPASGWLADRFGARRVYLVAIGIFTVGSILCALSHHLATLVAARVVQGLGGSLMVPVGRTIIVRASPRSELVSAMSWFTLPALIGPLLGPPLAGFILSIADWRWIFLINLPVSALGAFAVARMIPEFKESTQRSFDWSGYAIGASMVTLCVVTTEMMGAGVDLRLCAAAALAALGLLGIYRRHARRVTYPVLQLGLFSKASFRAAMVSGTIVRLGIGAMPLLLSLFFQLGIGWSPLKTGFITISQTLGVMLAKPIVARLVKRYGYRDLLIWSNLIAAVLSAAPAMFRADTPLWMMFVLLAVSGLARSLFFTANNASAYTELSNEEISSAATLASVIQQVGLAVGIGFGSLLLKISGVGNAVSFAMPFLVTAGVMGAASIAHMVLSRNEPVVEA